MSGQLRLAVLGAGRFAHVAMLAWARIGEVRPVMVSDIVPEAAAALARAVGARAVSVEEALGSGACDLVYVATPPWLQHDLAARALDGGMHVMCEKPMSLRLEEADDLVARAAKAGRLLGVDFMQRHGPLAASVKRVVDEELLGAPVRATFENYAKDEDLPPEHWFWAEERSGGIFVEHAVHFFDLFRWWFGDGRVVASLTARRPSDDDELDERVRIIDQVRATTVHGSVIVDQYHGFHQAERMDRQTMRVLFERGDIELDGWIPVQAKVRGLCDGPQLGRLAELFGGGSVRAAQIDGRVTSRHRARSVSDDVVMRTAPVEKSSRYLQQLEARFRDAVRAVTDPTHVEVVTAADARAALCLAIEARQSAVRC